MHTYYNTNFTGHWAVGTSAVVVAKDKKAAAKLLNDELIRIGLSQKVYLRDMIKIDINEENVYILQDGNY